MSTVPGYQNDLVLHPRTEGKKSTTKIYATGVCFPTLDKPGLIFNLVLKSNKISPTANGYTGTVED